MSDFSRETSVCDCCEDNALEPELFNPPGQSTLRYRIGAHGELVDRMLNGIARQRIPPNQHDGKQPLLSLSSRAMDDFAVGLIDAWAVVGDLLTFYQERIANEGFLRTATERRSVLELARTIGYELSPGVAAETPLVFTVDESEQTPDSAEVPAGTQVQSIPQKQNELPQTFETREPFAAHVDWNAMQPRQTKTQCITDSTDLLYFKGLATNLKVGDRLLLIDPDDATRWEVRRVQAVESEPENARTKVPVTRGTVQTKWQPDVYVFRQQAGIFGHNASDWPSISSQQKANYLGLDNGHQVEDKDKQEWPHYEIYAPGEHPIQVEGVRTKPVVVTAAAVADAAKSAAAAQAKAETQSAVDNTIAALVNIGAKFVDDGGDASAAFGKIVTGVLGFLGAFGIILPDFTEVTTIIMPEPVPEGDWWIRLTNQLKSEKMKEFQTLFTNIGGALDHLEEQIKKGPFSLQFDDAVGSQQLMEITTGLDELRKIGPGGVLQSLFEGVDSVGESLHGMASAAAAATIVSAVADVALLFEPTAKQMRDIINYTAAAATLAAESSMTPETVDESDSAADLEATLPFAEEIVSIVDQAVAPLLAMDAAFSRGAVNAAAGMERAVELATRERAEALPQTRSFYERVENTIDLDGRYNEITQDSLMVIEEGGDLELFTVGRVDAMSRAEFMLSMDVTRVILDRTIPNETIPATSVRTAKVYGAPETLELTEIEIPDAVIENTGAAQETVVTLDRRIELIPSGATLIVAGIPIDGETEVRETVQLKAATHQGPYTQLEFTRELSRRYRRDSVIIYGNVVNATHGETVSEDVLGAGDGARPHQRFKLNKPPLTYTAAATATGSESTLTVRVDGVAWRQYPSLYGLAPDTRGYTVRIDNGANAAIHFGDGKMGARVPTGQENVVAAYRSGIGLLGEVDADTLTLLKKRPFGVRSVTNPIAADGSDDPESLENARNNAPLTVRTLDRIVSLRDYEDFARAFAGIGKAQAAAVWNGSRELVHLTLADPTGEAAPDSTLSKLRAAIDGAREPGQTVCLDPVERRTFSLQAGLLIDPAYERERVEMDVRETLRRFFGFDRREFSQPVTAAEVTATIQEVAGIVAVDLDYLYIDHNGGSPTLNAVLAAKRAHFKSGAAIGCGAIAAAQMLLIDPAGITLVEMTT